MMLSLKKSEMNGSFDRAKNNAEERTRQRKEWRKRKREQKTANSTNTAIARSQPPSRNREANDFVPCIPEENAKKPLLQLLRQDVKRRK